MKIAIWYGSKDIRIEDAPKPKIDSNSALIKVKAVGICGSELHAYEGISERRKPPLIMGHEFSGEIEEVGENVKNLRKGDRVVINPIIPCLTCDNCLSGRLNICENVRLIGLHTPGAFAEYIAVPAENCYKIPDDLSFEEASMVEPMAVGIHAVRKASLRINDDVAIVGAGVIGLCTLQAAKIAGAGKIICSELVESRLKLAEKLGANILINAKEIDPVKKVMELTNGRGIDVAFEAVGVQKTVQQAIDMIKKGGSVIIIGMLAKKMELGILDIVSMEKQIIGSYVYTPLDFKTALNLISKKKANAKSLITHVFSLNEISKGFETLSKDKEAIKVIIKP
jgi:(R,R)-butanediol dehydrogenase/meso-butanediol dehydrogenase/diacetyl reductase